LVDVQNDHIYKCKLITAGRNPDEKSLGGGWYKFVKDRHLEEGDLLRCELDRPPKVMFVEVVPMQYV